MGKNNKKPAVDAAPAVNNATKTNVSATPEQIALTQHFIKNYSSMSPDSCVTALERIAKMVHDDADATQHLNITPEHQQFANELVYTGMMALVVTEIVAKKSAFAVTMSKAHLELVQKAAESLGIVFDGNFLPAPTATDADAVEVQMNSETVKVDNKTASAVKKEEEIRTNDAPELDPTKFSSDQDLAKAIEYILISEPAVFLKFTRAAGLMKSYLLIKAKDDKNEKEKINALSHGELLEKAFAAVGAIPIVLNGFGKCLYRETSQNASPVVAFTFLRNASKNKTTGEPTMSDSELADVTKVLIKYTASNMITDEQNKITKAEKDIVMLSKDKKNAKGVEDLKKKIEAYKSNIDHFNEVIDNAYNPSDEIAKTFIEDVQNAESENYKLARKLLSTIGQTYYGSDLKTLNQEDLRHNVQQMIGIITNLFRNPSEQIDGYSTANIVELKSSASSEEAKKN